MIVPVENIVETVDLTADDVLLPMMECIVHCCKDFTEIQEKGI